MPSDRDLERQLRAFGATLADRAGEPIRPDGARATAIGGARRRRHWAVLGAAACVVALVAGLLLTDQRDDAERGAAPAPSSIPTPTAVPTTVPTSLPVTVPTPTAPEPGAIEPERYLDADPLGLIADGWVRSSRVVEQLGAGGDDSTCEGSSILARIDQPSVHEIYTTPLLPGFDLDVSYLPIHAGPDLTAGVAALAGCPELMSVGAVSVFESSDGSSGFRLDDTFALIAVAPPAPMVPLSVVLELESEGVTDDLIGELVERTVAFLAAAPARGSRPPTTGAGVPVEIPSRPITEAERAELDGDDRGLVCDDMGIGAAEWDHGEITEADERGRRPVDAFRDALAQLTDDVLSEGGVALPESGWIELVASDSHSYFVLEVGGVRQGVISVSGDPAIGVWRQGSADTCQALFVPEGDTPSTTQPVVTAALPPREPPVTTAPGTPSITVEEYPATGGASPPGVAADDPVFVLVVSNQSFEDERVGLVITVDGQVVADDEYEVENQHTTSTYHVRGLAPGVHEVTVASDTGGGYAGTIALPDGAPHWAYVTYWYHPDDGRYIDLTEFDEPVAID